MRPLAWIDQSVTLARRLGAAFALRALLGALPLAAVVILAFYLERVEGIRGLRPLLAALLVAGFIARAFVVGGVAYRFLRERGLLADPDFDLRAHRPPASVAASVSFASLAAVVFTIHLVIAAAVARHGAFALVLGACPLVVWGAVAPSWLARVRIDADGGLRAFGRAAGDLRGWRVEAFLAACVLYAAQIVLLGNVLVALSLVVQAFHSFFGMDVAAAAAFLSWDNAFALLAICLFVLMLLEPLRVSLAVVAFVDASERRNGADLRAAITALGEPRAARGASAPSSRRAPAPGGEARRRAALGAALAIMFQVGGVHAQPVGDPAAPAAEPGAPEHRGQVEPVLGQLAPEVTYPEGEAAPAPAPVDETYGAPPPEYDPYQPYDPYDPYAPTAEPPYDPSSMGDPAAYVDSPPESLGAEDANAARSLDQILTRPEYREFRDAAPDPSDPGDPAAGEESWFTRLLRRFFEWIFGGESAPVAGAPSAAPSIPVPPVGLMVALLVVVILAAVVFLFATRARPDEAEEATGDGAVSTDPRDRPPEHHLAVADELARAGRYRDALRALYLATLVSLDRRREIDFDPARTNWHYLRQMRDETLRASFRVFTRLFDRVWYGRVDATRGDYEQGLALIEALCAPAPAGATSEVEPA